MIFNWLKHVIAVPALLLLFSSLMLAQSVAPTPRETPEQAPASAQDISGVWMGDGAGNNRNLLLQPATPLMLPWVKAKFDSKGATTERDPFLDYCEPLGAPRVLLTNVPQKFVQAPNEIVILYERNHDFREIYLDGRQHPKDVDPTWWGHSIGHWVGNTLIVDTVGFNDRTWLDWSGLPHSEALHLIERYQRIDRDTMLLDITVDDPKAYTRSFSAKRMFKLKPWDIGEDICTQRDEEHFRQGIVNPASVPAK